MTTREKLIHYTAQAIRIKGYYGTGIREILEETECPKGSLYHHFPTGKEGLVKEALIYSGEQMQKKISNALCKQSAKKGLRAMVKFVREEMEASSFLLADPLAPIASEVGEEWPDLRRLCAVQYEGWIEIVSNFLQKKKIDQPREKAIVFLMQLEGALLFAKTNQDSSYFSILEEQIPLLLKN